MSCWGSQFIGQVWSWIFDNNIIKCYFFCRNLGTREINGILTFGSCHRPIFSLGTSHCKQKITSLRKFELNTCRSSKLARKWWEKKTLFLDGFVCFQIGIKDFKIYATSEKAVSHNVLYYQQLSNVHYQVSF